MRFRFSFGPALALSIAVTACSGSNHMTPQAGGVMLGTPKSVSPGSIRPAPMAKTTILPAGVMAVKPQSAIQGLNWTQIPGAASFAAAAPDGSLWALSTSPAGPDKYIWHYVSGTWTNISGLAARLSVAPNGTLYAINSGGGAYSYAGGNWTALGGGASDISVASDGSFYVLSNGNTAGSDQAIWHNVSGTWSQDPGSGVRIAASWDSSSYALPGGTITANGLYVLNSSGSIYYKNSGNTYVPLPGSASAVAPASSGGVFVLGYPAQASGNSIYYYDLSSSRWSAQGGAGVGISSSGTYLYAIGSSGGIFSSTVTPSSTPTPAPSSTPTPPAPTSASVSVNLGLAKGATVAVSAGTVPVGVTIPGPAVGGGPVSVIGSTSSSGQPCVTMGSSTASLSFAESPSFTLVLPSSMPTSGQSYYLVTSGGHAYTSSSTFEGPAIVYGQTLQFFGAIGFQFLQGNAITFCLTAVQNTPSPSPSPLPASSPGTLAVSVSGVTTSMHSLVATMNGSALPTAAIPSTCGSACTINIPAPAVSNATFGVTTYASTDGSGYPLGLAPKVTATIIASATTTINAPLSGVLASIGVTLSPSSVNVGMYGAPGSGAPISVCVNAKDASGNAISGNYVDVNGSQSPFSAGMVDTTGQTIFGTDSNGNPVPPRPGTCATLNYSGIGSGPATVQVFDGNITGSASLSFTGRSTFTPALAAFSGYFYEFQAGQANATNLFATVGIGTSSGAALDSNGLLWIDPTSGYSSYSALRSDGTVVTTVADSTIAYTRILAIDSTGLIYATDSSSTSNPGANLYVYSVNMSAGTESLVRYISMAPGGLASASVDHSGNIYVTIGGVAKEFPPGTSSGSVTPTATDSRNTYNQIEADSQGDVFAANSGVVYKWPPGTFGSLAPQVVPVTVPSGDSINSIAVFPDGSGCAELVTGRFLNNFAGEATWTGSLGTTPVCPNLTAGVAQLLAPPP